MERRRLGWSALNKSELGTPELCKPELGKSAKGGAYPRLRSDQESRSKANKHSAAALAIGIAAMVLAAGCGPRHETPWPDYRIPAAVSTPAPGDQFAAVKQAAAQARIIAGSQIDNISFKAKQSTDLEKALGPVIASLKAARSGTWTFPYAASDPFQPRPDNLAWSFIGRVLTWRITSELAAGQGDQAVDDFLLGTRLGFMLTAGDARDASTGDQIADEVRQALMTNIGSLGASQLQNLSNRLAQIEALRAPRSQTVTQQHAQMMATLQSVQDLYAKDSLDDLAKDLGDRAQEAINTLQTLQTQGRPSQIAFFLKLRDDADLEYQWLQANASIPTAKRAPEPTFRSTRSTSWHAAAATLFTEGSSWLEIDDACVARTRLLVLYSKILAQVKSTKAAPKDLNAFPPSARLDPYTGSSFFYVPKGTDFLLYSAGENGLDDGGATDPSFTTPDLFLEGTR